MKCPKCDGQLLFMSAPKVKDLEGKDCIDINLECSQDESHFFFVRIHEEDLLEG